MRVCVCVCVCGVGFLSVGRSGGGGGGLVEMEWVEGRGLVPNSPRQTTFTSIQMSLPLSTHEKVNPRFTVEAIGRLDKR